MRDIDGVIERDGDYVYIKVNDPFSCTSLEDAERLYEGLKGIFESTDTPCDLERRVGALEKLTKHMQDIELGPGIRYDVPVPECDHTWIGVGHCAGEPVFYRCMKCGCEGLGRPAKGIINKEEYSVINKE